MVFYQGFVADAYFIGMQGGHLYQTVDQQSYRHVPLRIAFGGGEEVGLFENFVHWARY